MRTLRTGSSAMLTRAGVSALLALAAVGGASTASTAATTTAQPVMTLSNTTGPTGGGNYLTVSLPSTATQKFVSGFVGVQFQNVTATTQATATCSTNPATSGQVTLNPATSLELRVLSTTKISIKVPSLSSGSTGFWLLCAYNQAYSGSALPTTATVLGKANYITASAPTPSAISPATGPAAGGQTITITGGAGSFPTTITAQTPLTATLGGVPLTNIVPLGATSFTAVTPARPASTATPVLQVTTAGGTATLANAYTYVNGINVSPNTVPAGQSVDVDVTGSGFLTLTFDSTSTAADIATASGANAAAHTNSASAHVYLVQSTQAKPTYDGTGYAATDKGNGQKSECVDPVVISDNELICTVNAGYKITNTAASYQYVSGNLATGTYHMVVVSNGSVAAPTFQSSLSSGSTFTVADF